MMSWTPKKHYVVKKNDEEKYWSWTGGPSGNGGWAKIGSYYQTEKDAQDEIDNLRLDTHVEFDVW